MKYSLSGLFFASQTKRGITIALDAEEGGDDILEAAGGELSLPPLLPSFKLCLEGVVIGCCELELPDDDDDDAPS